jgi:O-succinylbenzoic acid--CoA ligase
MPRHPLGAMKPLVQVPASDVAGMIAALRDALDGGPAVWPVADAAPAGRGATQEPTVDDRIALVVETSGSTAAPKRVVLSAEALVASADATHDRLGDPGQWLLALPARYIAGAQVLVRSIVAGTDPVVLDEGSFDAGAFAAASAELDPNTPRYTALVPVQLARVVDGAERDPFIAAALMSYDAVLVGGQALSPDLAERAVSLGARIVRTYGSSETAGGCVYDGRPLEGVGVRTVDDVIELSGAMLAEGYLDDPERTATAFTTDARGIRWYRTGDLGVLGDDGLLRVRGRADDVIISGGVKVVLGEVERAIRAVPGFGSAVVVAVPDLQWGERAAVVIPGEDGRGASALESVTWATDAAGLGPAARPVLVVPVDAMPMLASGKPDRRALAELARGGRAAGIDSQATGTSTP